MLIWKAPNNEPECRKMLNGKMLNGSAMDSSLFTEFDKGFRHNYNRFVRLQTVTQQFIERLFH
jgi:hypothetical protein